MLAMAVHQAQRIAPSPASLAPTEVVSTIAFGVTVLILFGAFSSRLEVIFLSHLI
ncbi:MULTISPECIES: hypothetical protein [Pseudomonas]|uniref:hypothetical protein n=1 Tax=Pseudomonas TaxID=286 RepID=UPI0012E2B5E1|nr:MULTISPECIES: hypothetical protein [Pseudomonas]